MNKPHLLLKPWEPIVTLWSEAIERQKTTKWAADTILKALNIS